MAQKRIGQLGFMDAALSQRRKRRDRLSEISALIDWAPFEAVLSGLRRESGKGEAAWPALMLFKALLLQRWYDLSDPQMEEALFDRLSFQAFCGLSLDDDVPDHCTLWRFREALIGAGMMERLFSTLAAQLEARGAVLKRGTLIDASLITAAARRPRLDEGPTSASDPDARFGTNNESRRYTFGYKLHVAADEGSGLLRGAVVTPANVQEIDVAMALVQGDEGAIVADRGYDGGRLHDLLAARGIGDEVMRRARKGPLSPDEVVRNHARSLRRRPVEAVFGTLKRVYRMGRLRYFNLRRNTLGLMLACFAFNLRRLHSLAAP